MFHYRFRIYSEFGMQPTAFACEKSVYPYCFGPMNGDVPFGQLRSAYPVEFRAWEPMLPNLLRRTVSRLVTTLVRSLDDAAQRAPGDRWVTGQRVFQRVQSGEIEQAQKVARECRAESWWCASLVGYTSYLLDQHGRADSAFSVALAALPGEERCNWESIGDLVYGDSDRRWYVGLTCAERVDANRAIWWLADPLYLTPGNERRSAHFYREIFRQLFFDSNEELPQFIGSSFVEPTDRITGSGRRVRIGPSLSPRLACTMHEREVWQQASLRSLIRGLGVPAYFMLQRNSEDVCCGCLMDPRRQEIKPLHDPRILLQYQQPTYHFLPELVAARAPLRATADMWDAHDSNAVERYRPSFGTFSSLDYQLAYFRRGDSARIVAAADLAGNQLLSGRSNPLVSSALVLSRTPDDIRILRDSIPGTNVTFLSAAPAESTIVSLEALVSGVGAVRARFASGPPPMPRQRLSASDVLLLDSGGDLPPTLEAAAARARPNVYVPRDAPLGLYWELYGLSAGDSITVALAAAETGRSVATNIGRFIGVVRDARQSIVRWAEPIASDEPIAPRTIALDLSTLSYGGYTITLEVAIPRQDTVRVARNIEIVR